MKKSEAYFDFVCWCMLVVVIGWVTWLLYHGSIWEIIAAVLCTILEIMTVGYTVNSGLELFKN